MSIHSYFRFVCSFIEHEHVLITIKVIKCFRLRSIKSSGKGSKCTMVQVPEISTQGLQNIAPMVDIQKLLWWKLLREITTQVTLISNSMLNNAFNIPNNTSPDEVSGIWLLVRRALSNRHRHFRTPLFVCLCLPEGYRCRVEKELLYAPADLCLRKSF